MPNDKMMKMMMGKKKQGKLLSEPEKKAKLQALGGMRDMASQMMGNKLKNLKKVTVASNSPAGLKAGLHKAEDMTSELPDHENSLDDADQESQDPRAYSEGGKIGQMPSEFDRDEDHVISEHNTDEEPRHFDEGGMTEESPGEEASESSDEENQEQESMDKMVADSPDDVNDLDELIKKLEEKKQKLSQ